MTEAAAQDKTFSSALIIDFWGTGKSNLKFPSKIKK
jgi:hypothetical protein